MWAQLDDVILSLWVIKQLQGHVGRRTQSSGTRWDRGKSPITPIPPVSVITQQSVTSRGPCLQCMTLQERSHNQDITLSDLYLFLFLASTLVKIFVIIWVSGMIPSWLENTLFFLSLRFVLWTRIWYTLVPWALEKSMFQREICKCWSEHTGWWCSWLYAHTSDFLASCRSGG